MLVSHFLLDLQETNRQTVRMTDSAGGSACVASSELGSVSFAARVVGSLGSTLVYTASSRGEAEEDVAGVELGARPGRRGLSVEDGGDDGPGEFVAADGARASGAL